MVKKPLDCGFTVVMKPAWHKLPEKEARSIISKFDKPNSNPGDWGKDYIVGMVSSDDERATTNDLKKYLESALDDMPVKHRNLVDRIVIDECNDDD
jgi:hypothetical protein